METLHQHYEHNIMKFNRLLTDFNYFKIQIFI